MNDQQWKNAWRRVTGGWLLLALVWGICGYAWGRTTAPGTPRCAEDAVIVGYGDFKHGRWSSYRCGPATDDLAGCPIAQAWEANLNDLEPKITERELALAAEIRDQECNP